MKDKLPNNAYQKAKVNEWVFFSLMELDCLVIYTLRKHEKPENLGLSNLYGEAPNAIIAARDHFDRMIKACENNVPENGWLFGKSPSIADIMFISCLMHCDKFKIEIKKPTQLINTHNVFQISEPLVESFNERLLFLRCVRNPVYNILDWAEYFEKVGEDPREMNFYLGKKQIPWFVSQDNQDLFASVSLIEKAAIMYIELESLSEKIESKKIFNEKNLLIIPFEKLTKDKELTKSIRDLTIGLSKFLNEIYP